MRYKVSCLTKLGDLFSLQVCFARIVDYKRQFMKAALRYYELSQIVPEQERMDALQYSIICSILAAAGPQRSRMLSTLFKDERSSKTDIYPILEKMFVLSSFHIYNSFVVGT